MNEKTTAKYLNPSLAIEERIEDLLKRMTLEEKIGQLIQLPGWTAYTKTSDGVAVSEDFKKNLCGAGIGSLYGVLRADPWTQVTIETGLTPEKGAEAVNAIQRYAIENTRLGIPLLFGEECSHGHMAIGGTVFPVPIAAASTWNPEIFRKMCSATAAETRAQGGAATYSPILDVARDPRWGRTEETFGEDTYLCGEMGVAAVKGLQGDDLNSGDTIVATVKHFAGHGSPEGGHNSYATHIGTRELHEVHLNPFKKTIKAGALSVMASYNEIDGVPCSGSKALLDELLKKEWGFKGFVVSDMGSVKMLHERHNVADSLEAAAALSLEAGLDMEMAGEIYGSYLKKAIEGKMTSVEYLDKAVERILWVKFILGLFENPYSDPGKARTIVGCSNHKKLAREIAQQGTVLLKNRKDILPLNKNIKSIAVIGPNADNMYNQLGDYTAPQPRNQVVTVLDGIRNKVSAGTVVHYAKGCGIRSTSREGFGEAVEAARKSDVAILVVGGSSARDFGENTHDNVTGAAIVTDSLSEISDMDSGEGFDRASLELSGVQLDLVKEIKKTGIPVIVVLINGRPLILNWIDENVDGLLEAWYPGQEGGNAVADVLFGDYNPAGRLPISFPRSEGQLPVYYNQKRYERKRYVEMEATPLFSFGFGLSYTNFRYENLRLEPAVIKPDESAVVSVDITNTGAIKGDEVVQLYIRDEYSSIARRSIELKGFERISLEPGERKRVKFAITPEKLQFLDAHMEPTVEPGLFKIMLGGSQNNMISTCLEVVKG